MALNNKFLSFFYHLADVCYLKVLSWIGLQFFIATMLAFSRSFCLHEYDYHINHNYNKIREEYDSGVKYLTG